jgi:predicted pyridoxine 5'-phosphate oxidase superfamily flavin-nucleotide-binding protein
MVRKRGEPNPDPQELLQDTDNDGTSVDDESVSSHTDR